MQVAAEPCIPVFATLIFSRRKQRTKPAYVVDTLVGAVFCPVPCIRIAQQPIAVNGIRKEKDMSGVSATRAGYCFKCGCYALVIGLLVSLAANAQTSFVDITPLTDNLFVTSADEDFWMNAAAPADVDGDGDLDLAVIGFYVVYNVSAVDRLVIFINEGPDIDGRWKFTQQEVPLGEIYAGSSDLAWGDYDADGDPDLVVASEGVTKIFRNDAGTLVQTDIQLPGYYEDSNYTGAYDLRSVTWADIDNDSDLDLLIPSTFDFTNFEFRTSLMRNEGLIAGEWTFSEVPADIDATVHAQSAWADDDGDGDLDLFLTDINNISGDGFVRRFDNNAGSFVGTNLVDISVQYGLADWGDYDADGDMDILVAGNIRDSDGTYGTVLRIYDNQNGTFVDNTLVSANFFPWLDIHAATWADYDSDGDVDILLTGNVIGDSEIVGKSDIYANEGNSFVPLDLNLPAPLSSVGRGGAFLWFDIDNDGDLDYFVGGAYYVPGGNGLVEAKMRLYMNDGAESNGRPSAPSSLLAVVDGTNVNLAWNPSTDDSTPTAAITYDLELRPSGQSAPTAVRLPEPGNISAVTNWEFRNLPLGSYVWMVRGVDSAFNGSVAAEGSFTIGEPVVDVSISPNRGQIIVVPQLGGQFGYSLAIVNRSGQQQTWDYWVEVSNSERLVQTIGPFTRTLDDGQSVNRLMRQFVDSRTPAGTYRQTLKVGSFPGNVTESASFLWHKR
jgi:hypothetical protein